MPTPESNQPESNNRPYSNGYTAGIPSDPAAVIRITRSVGDAGNWHEAELARLGQGDPSVFQVPPTPVKNPTVKVDRNNVVKIESYNDGKLVSQQVYSKEISTAVNEAFSRAMTPVIYKEGFIAGNDIDLMERLRQTLISAVTNDGAFDAAETEGIIGLASKIAPKKPNGERSKN